ncbi:right-handed parallel beta-helix repeat-containing protein [Halomicrobium salinisoli]|uniref:right-handed parallel beta-helix repeat-containing protein n=1 Tax=Halomicrobium salinisoli TaxID=2878391 RepID=UPI001CF038C1|nr:right-handed parallel beta-helix repeat-containing protein [Halomicrobium salinisoli]
MDRRSFLAAAGVAAVGAGVGTSTLQRGFRTIGVPRDADSIQAGVDAASPGDLVLVDAGTYDENVVVSTPGVTLRGVDRNAVVLDGDFDPGNGVDVAADGVAVENLTVRRFQGTGVYWHGVAGFRGSYLTAYNNGYYGIYATGSSDGRFEYSYASGHPDAGFYLGRHRPYDATVANVVAEHNAVGYSGTSTGGRLTVRDSIFRHNRTGVLPNTLDTTDPPQRASRFVGNVVSENDDEDAPALRYVAPTFGMGVVLWGASDNVVADNRVDGHPNFGIVADHNVVAPSGNEVRNNVVRGSGEADLALGAPAGEGNRFAGNQFATSAPSGLRADASDGSRRVAAVFERQAVAQGDPAPGGDWRDQPEPDPKPTMRDPGAPPRIADRATSWGDDGENGDGEPGGGTE